MINRESNPGAGVMASFTHAGGIDVSWRFTACADTIVALHTVSGDAAMIKSRADKAGRIMAGVALHRRRDMIDGLAARGNTVVATCANSEDLGVINNKRRPCARPMASFTRACGHNMRRRFSTCIDTIVALHAIYCNAGVIKNGSEKARCIVASVALGGRHNVIDGLAARTDAVMATRTCSEYLRVIDREGGPSTGPVTGLARIR